MNNSRNNKVLNILIYVVILAVFNAVFFLATGSYRTPVQWIGYLFIHIAVLALILTPFLVTGGSSAHIFGMALGAVSSTYLIVTFVVNLILMLATENVTVALIINIVITGIFLIGLLTNVMANNTTADSVARHEAEVQYIKVCSMRLKALQAGIFDPQLAKSVEGLYDLIHSSPSKSNASAQDVELQIITMIGGLEANVQAGNVEAAMASVGTITQLANERNRRLMLY